MEEHCKTRIVVDGLTIYLFTEFPPHVFIENGRVTDIRYELVKSAVESGDSDEIDFIDYGKVSAVSHRWVPADNDVDEVIEELSPVEEMIVAIVQRTQDAGISIRSVTDQLQANGHQISERQVGIFMYDLQTANRIRRIKNGKWRSVITRK